MKTCTETEMNTTPSLFWIGDSISLNYHADLRDLCEGAYAYRRKEGMDEAARNLDEARGANGGDSVRVLAYLRAALGEGAIPEDVLVVNCGLHDIKRDRASGTIQVSPEDYRAHLQSLVALAEDAGKRLLWIRTTPVDETRHALWSKSFDRREADLEVYNRIADEVMDRAGVPVIDLHGFTASLPGELFRDHVHFHPWVSRAQAGFLRRELDRLWRPDLPPAMAFLGDSITDAGHAREDPTDPGEGYLAALAGHLPEVRLLNYGISGNRVEDMRARLDSVSLEASSLVLYGGVNDVVHIFKRDRPQTVSSFSEEYEALLDEALRLGIHVRVLLPFVAEALPVPRAQPWWPLPGEGYEAWHREIAPRQAAIQAACDARDVPWMALQPLFGETGHPLSEDGVHPTPEGHAVLAEALASWLGDVAPPGA